MKATANRIVSLLLTTVLLASLAACSNDDAHEDERGVVVVLDNSSCGDAAIGQTRLCVYDTGGNLCATYDYADASAVASALLPLEAGRYTLAVVVNADEPSTAAASLTSLREWVARQAGAGGGLLSGVAAAAVEEDGLTRVVLPLRRGAFSLPALRVRFALPGVAMADYTPARVKTLAANAGSSLRCVAELRESGSGQVALHKAATPQLQADGAYAIELQLSEGDYDLRLWADYAGADAPLADTYYNAGSLEAVSVSTNPYGADADAKDAACGDESGISVSGDTTTVSVTLRRPVANYRIMANDVDTYRRLMELEPDKYPPLEELTATVRYEGFLPSEFNVWNNVVTDATAGISFSTMLTGADVGADGLPIASDWILASGESSVTVTLTVCDSNGNTICSVGGVTVAYRQGCQTTIVGKFLTAGVNVGGITIEPDWDDITIEF